MRAISSGKPCKGPALHIVSFLLAFAFLIGPIRVLAQEQAESANEQIPAIRFVVSIPAAPEEMQVYRLEATKPPLDFVNEKLRGNKLPPLRMEEKLFIARSEAKQSGSKENDTESVRAFVDPVNGDLHLMPNFAELVHSEKADRREEVTFSRRAQSVARSAFADQRFIPRDATQLAMAEPISILGGTITRGKDEKSPGATASRGEPGLVLTIVPAVRYVAGFRVYGRGSHAVISVANDGAVVGALRRWRTASPAERIRTSMSGEEVRERIERQLRPAITARGTRATVDKISVAYYDANEKYLQPVYYFEATVKAGAEHGSSIKIAGYIPLGKVLEPIPDLAAPATGEKPIVPKQASRLSPPTNALPEDPADITLGEYANRDWPHDAGYVSMSNSFLRGLTFLNSIIPGATPPVTRTQWFDAYPWEVVGPSSKYYLNAVNVAYTVPHGDWLVNTTLSNNADAWFVPNIGTGGNPGFGAAAGGVLATWIIMSCEVIPSMYDRQNEIGGTGNPYTAFDAWWPVFQGLHNAIGFRTIMFYPDDNLQFGFGFDASVGGDINAAWFQEVAANDGDDGTYCSQHLIGPPLVHYDRASTMIDARDLGQSIYNVRPQSASTTLWNFWMDN